MTNKQAARIAGGMGSALEILRIELSSELHRLFCMDRAQLLREVHGNLPHVRVYVSSETDNQLRQRLFGAFMHRQFYLFENPE